MRPSLAGVDGRERDGHRHVPLQPARVGARAAGARPGAAPWTSRAAGILRDVRQAVEARDWLAVGQRLTLAGILGAGGFLAGVALGVAVTLVGMAPGWIAHPVTRVAGVLSALPVPKPLTIVAVLAAGFLLVRVRWCGRWLLALARVAVVLLALAVAWQMLRA